MTQSKIMGSFDKLKEWIVILMNVKTLSQEAKEIQKRSNPEWYFSEEGKAAYIAADTPAKKTKYFFDYLMAVRDKDATPEKAKDTFFKIAVVMASTMDNSSLEFAGYPNILQKEKNPLVRNAMAMFDKMFEMNANDPKLFAYFMLPSLHQGGNRKLYLKKNAYRKLSYCKDGEELSDLYKIERAIIGIGGGESGPLLPFDNYKLSFSNDEEDEENGESEENN